MGNSQLLWTLKERSSSASKIFGWTAGICNKVLEGVSNATTQVLPVSDFTLTLLDVEPRILDALSASISKMDIHSLCIHGVAGCGKTPGMMAIFMAYVRRAHQLNPKLPAPSVRLCSTFDGFRLSEGTATCGDILDDPDLSSIPGSALKGFADVGMPGHIVQRWGAYKAARGAPRGWTCNDLDLDREPEERDGRKTITHVEFWNMVRCSFARGLIRTHIMAIFKRASIVLVTNRALYCRPANGLEVDVDMVCFGTTPDFIIAGDARDFYQSWRRNDEAGMAKFPLTEDKIDAEQALLKTILEKSYPEPVPAPVHSQPRIVTALRRAERYLWDQEKRITPAHAVSTQSSSTSSSCDTGASDSTPVKDSPEQAQVDHIALDLQTSGVRPSGLQQADHAVNAEPMVIADGVQQTTFANLHFSLDDNSDEGEFDGDMEVSMEMHGSCGWEGNEECAPPMRGCKDDIAGKSVKTEVDASRGDSVKIEDCALGRPMAMEVDSTQVATVKIEDSAFGCPVRMEVDATPGAPIKIEDFTQQRPMVRSHIYGRALHLVNLSFALGCRGVQSIGCHLDTR